MAFRGTTLPMLLFLNKRIILIALVCIYTGTIQQACAQCSVTVATFPYTEGFEANDGNWVPGGSGSDWAWGTPAKTTIITAGGGDKCWITGGLTNSFYNSQDSWLQSPCFNFSTLQHPAFYFSLFWETAKNADGGSLQYSIDGGNTWLLLGSTSDNSCTATDWYNCGSVTNLGATQGWSGNGKPTMGSCPGGNGSNGWLTARHDLSFLAGQSNVIFRFRFGAGSTCNNYDGFAIDEITISESNINTPDFIYQCIENKTVHFFSTAIQCALSYSWDFGDPASGVNNNSGLQDPLHTFSSTGTYTVTLVSTTLSGASTTVTHTIEIIDVSITVTGSILCSGDKTVSLFTHVSGGSGIYNYLWNTSPPVTTPDLLNISGGTYIVSVNSATSCLTRATAVVVDPGAITVNIKTSPARCGKNNGTAVTTVTNGVRPYQYAWSTGANTASLNNLGPGNYSCRVTDANGCYVLTNNIRIARDDKPEIVSLGNDTILCKGEQLILSPGKFVSYEWQDHSTGAFFTVKQTGVYTVHVTDSVGCSGSATIHIVVDCSDVMFPNAFTPDNNGVNDYFGPLGNIAALKNYRLRIYNRWGQLVFVSSDPSLRWDGTFKGMSLEVGNYLWFAVYDIFGKQRQVQKGILTLVR